jgi:large subunit ribosomal protein L25
MSNSNLTFQKRDPKLNPRQIRKQGFIPVTVYGRNLKESLTLQVAASDYTKLGLSKTVQVFNGQIDGGNNDLALLIKSIEKHPVTGEVYNIQFQNVSPDQKVKITVPIIYEGASPLVQAGGTLFLNKKFVTLVCPSKLVQSSVKFDLNSLNGDKTIAYYSDLPLPTDVVLKSDVTQIIAKVSMPQATADKAAA